MKSFIFVTIITLTFSTFCCKKNIKDPDGGTTNSNNTTNNANAHDTMPEKKYLKEGFISKNTYRIVIVSTKEDCENSSDDIKNKASKRAFVSLKKLLADQNSSITPNINARLLSLVENNSKFTRKEDACNKFNIYYFDIKKDNLKRYLNNISD